MIDEKFYQAAINIRRTYLKLTSELEKYKDFAEATMINLNKSTVDIERLQKQMKEARKEKKPNSGNIISEINRILDNIEMEGKKIENFIDPINKDIEKLAEEEQILYKSICQSHPNLSEDQIVDAVRRRLIKENL